MGNRIILTRAQLKVFSQIASNLAVVWLVAILVTGSASVLIRNIILAIMFWYLAVKAEEKSEDL